MEFEQCLTMLCNWQTEHECIDRNLFGDQARRREALNEIKPCDIGFPSCYERVELIGVFRACSEAQLHIEPKAWKGKFAAQVRVEPIGELRRVKDAAYTLRKAGVGTRQSVSGPLVPKYPVHGREVGEKLLANFRDPKK